MISSPGHSQSQYAPQCGCEIDKIIGLATAAIGLVSAIIGFITHQAPSVSSASLAPTQQGERPQEAPRPRISQPDLSPQTRTAPRSPETGTPQSKIPAVPPPKIAEPAQPHRTPNFVQVVPSPRFAAASQGQKSSAGNTWIGVRVQKIDDVMASTLGLARTVGVIVVDVTPDGSAARAGLKSGDAIISVDDVELVENGALGSWVRSASPGTLLRLSIVRNGETSVVCVEIDELPKMGVTLAQAATGVSISSVIQNSPADKSGLRASDLILKIDGEAVTTIDAVYDAIRRAAANDTTKPILMFVSSGGQKSYKAVRLGTGNKIPSRNS